MPLRRLREVPWDALRSDLALPAIARVLEGAAAEREIDRTLRSHRGLSRDERTALVEAIFGVALWRRRLAWHAHSSNPADLLRALISDLAGPSPATPERLADRWSLPDWLEAHLERELGAEADAFCKAISAPGPVCLRANRLLCTRDELAARLTIEGIATRPAQRSPDALFVETKQANLFGSAAWRDGLFEPQDEGSQLVGQLVEARPGETVLDLCAGAGGKSLQLAAQGATVFAHDISAQRLQRLRNRAVRAGATLIEIVPAPAAADRVLVDAPCSELGTLRRGPDARWRIDPGGLGAFPPIQRELLETAARCAQRRMVYATCTIHRAENEDVAARFDLAHPEFRRTRTEHFLPHLHGTDGFFAAVWERNE